MACLDAALGDQASLLADHVGLVDLGRDRAVGACAAVVGAFAVYDHAGPSHVRDSGVEDPQALGRVLEVRVGRDSVARVDVGRYVAGAYGREVFDPYICDQAGLVYEQDACEVVEVRIVGLVEAVDPEALDARATGDPCRALEAEDRVPAEDRVAGGSRGGAGPDGGVIETGADDVEGLVGLKAAGEVTLAYLDRVAVRGIGLVGGALERLAGLRGREAVVCVVACGLYVVGLAGGR